MAGQQFGANGADMGNLNSVMNFEQAQGAIKQFVTPVIGQPKTDEYLKNFSSNWVKSFVAGVAEKSPQAAAAMLQQPNIAEHFTSQDVVDMADVIKKTERQQQLIQNPTDHQEAMAAWPTSSMTLTPRISDKRATIDRMDANGDISPKAAASARRVIKSTEDADSQTDTCLQWLADIVE